jgi:hypothetical protein
MSARRRMAVVMTLIAVAVVVFGYMVVKRAMF